MVSSANSTNKLELCSKPFEILRYLPFGEIVSETVQTY